MLSATANDGSRVDGELKVHSDALPQLARRDLGQPLAAFLEAHIEQGPILERIGASVGAVSGVQGRRVYKIEFKGRTGHAGTVPYSYRADALEMAVRFLSSLYARARSDEDIRITPGRIVVEPNSPSVIPGRATLTLDIRHRSSDVVSQVPLLLEQFAHAVVQPDAVTIAEIDRADPVCFDLALTRTVSEGVRRETGVAHLLVSGASHDAQVLAGFCPTAMVFVRCRGGISHHPDEFASTADLAAGTRILSACLLSASGALMREACGGR
jgi:N-carbamoyl-L-amino-acid hydrolase